MAAHPLEVAQFALILIDEARARGSHQQTSTRSLATSTTSNQSVTVDVRVNQATVGSAPTAWVVAGARRRRNHGSLPHSSVRIMLSLYQTPNGLPG